MSKKSLQESFSAMAQKSIARYGYFSLESLVSCKIKHRKNRIQMTLATRERLVPFNCLPDCEAYVQAVEQQEDLRSEGVNKAVSWWEGIASLTSKLQLKKERDNKK